MRSVRRAYAPARRPTRVREWAPSFGLQPRRDHQGAIDFDEGDELNDKAFTTLVRDVVTLNESKARR